MAPPEPANLTWVGDRYLRIAFDPHADPSHLQAAHAHLRSKPISCLRDLTPAYATLLLHFDLLGLDHDHAEHAVRVALEDSAALAPSVPSHPVASRLIEVPACYDQSCAPDLADVASHHGLSIGQVVALHSAPEYLVRFIGFSPGFPYLQGLPSRLFTPRLATPRPRVPEGSIAIAGDQAGIYPRATPGGWRLIARTALSLFDPAASSPSVLRLGDRVRFVPISLAEFESMRASSSQGNNP